MNSPQLNEPALAIDGATAHWDQPWIGWHQHTVGGASVRKPFWLRSAR